jgi:hypothetical protein
MGKLTLDGDSVPLHFEGLSMRPHLAAVGWEVAGVCTVGGVAIAVVSRGPVVEAAGVMLTLVGVVMLVALLRCRRFETVVGRKLLEAGAGPFRRRVPVGYIERCDEREASSWRALFSDREIVLWLTARDRMLVIPTRDPESIITAIGQAQGGVGFGAPIPATQVASDPDPDPVPDPDGFF